MICHWEVDPNKPNFDYSDIFITFFSSAVTARQEELSQSKNIHKDYVGDR